MGGLRDAPFYEHTLDKRKMSTSIPTNIFSKLMGGHYGLAMTYWGFGTGVGLLITGLSYGVSILATRLILQEQEVAGQSLIYGTYGLIFVYFLMVAMGVFAASKTYQGNKVWSVLARIFIVLGLLRLAVNIASPVGGLHGDELARQTVFAMQANLPMMLDENIELSRARAEGALVHYDYRLTKVEQQEGMSFPPGAFSQTPEQVCAEPDTLTLLNAGVSMQFNYLYSNGQLIDSFLVPIDFCKGW